MLIENLIWILKKCESLKGACENIQVLLPDPDGDDRVNLIGFIVYSHRDQAITLYPSKPDWTVDEKDRDIEISILSETDSFAEITWREL